MKIVVSLLLLLPSSLAFVVGPAPSNHRRGVQLEASRRREFLVDAAIFGTTLLTATPALAAKKEVIPATHANVKAAFDDLRYELNGKDGGVDRMQTMIDSNDWEGLMDITKMYDQELRKGKVGKCKSFLSDKEKSITTVKANAITFDLIGMNRNARPGQENAAEANRYLEELRTDLQQVLDEEKYVQYEDLP